MTDVDPHQELCPPPWPITDDAIRNVFESMLKDGSWGRYHGPHCDRLRAALADFHSVEHVALCSSGTAAVELALRAAKVEAGDEVILAAYDYKANFANVLTLQATPVLVDTVPGMPVLDPEQLEGAITGKTRAIICSHLHGSFARVSDIRDIASQRSITVVEDACQAAGGILNGKPTGSIGDIGVLSFGGSKLLTAGRGGAILTNDGMMSQRMRLYTQRGNDAYPLSEMQAAVLVPQLKRLPERTLNRRMNARRIIDALSEVDSLSFQALSDDEDNVEALYKLAIRYRLSAADGMSREAFTTAARQRGVALDRAFSALHLIHSQRRFRKCGELPHATRLHHELMTLHHPLLLDTDMTDKTIDVLKSLLQTTRE